MSAVPNITPVNNRAQLSEIAARIVDLLRQRDALSEQIRAQYQEAADLGAPKPGFKLAVAHSRLEEERLEDIRRGYRAGADALDLQGELF